MSKIKINTKAIKANRKRIFKIDAEVMTNKANAYISRSMIEENRLMILSNYSAAFLGNRQLANSNTEEIFENRKTILDTEFSDAWGFKNTFDDVFQEDYVFKKGTKHKIGLWKNDDGSLSIQISERTDVTSTPPQSSQDTEKIFPRTAEIAKTIISTYLILTLLCGLFYWFFGMSVFDSIAHSMTTIATGGFSTHTKSIGYFQSSDIEIVATVFIILGSIPFISYLKFLKGNSKVFFQDVQIRGLIYLLLVSIFIMFLYLFFTNNEISLLDRLRISSFNVVSILSGTGYITDDFGLWGKFPLIFFLFLMFVGGCAGSTTCGIKIFRLQMLFLFFQNQIKKLIFPNSVSIIKYNNQKISENFITSVIIFVFSYLFLFIILATLLSIAGLDFLSAISGAATSISNVGPGLGEMIGPNGNFSQVSDVSKWLLSFGMLLGRLELFAVLVLFFPSFWRN